MNEIHLTGGPHAVLMLHGLSGGPAEMAFLARRLNGAGFTVSAPGIRGYSHLLRHPREEMSWRRWRECVMRSFSRLAKQHDSVSVTGLCTGAVLALDLAAAVGNQVSALSLLSTTLSFDGYGVPRLRFLLPLARFPFARRRWSYREREPYGLKNEALRKLVARQMARTGSSLAGSSTISLEHIYQASRLMHQMRTRLQDVHVPVLIVHADQDEVASPRNADLVHRGVSSRLVRKVMLRNSFHLITLDNDRERVAEETSSFLWACLLGKSGPATTFGQIPAPPLTTSDGKRAFSAGYID